GDVVEQDDLHARLRPLLAGVGQEGRRPRPPDRPRQLPLVSGAAPGDPPGRDLASLRDEVPEPANVLVVDEVDLVDAELADLAPAEPAPLAGFAGRGNGSLLSSDERDLEGDLVVRRPRLHALGRRPGAGGRLGAAHELDALGHHLDDAALLTFL